MVKSFSFLVTTDNHLGYKQDDNTRRKDSFMAFKEALQLARERDVDFILLGGDLFHVNRPSSAIEHKCIKIIRQHMNSEADRGVRFKRVAGDFSHFERIKHGNFEDHNLKVPYPILTIHGNHDDPTGPNAKSVCEKLATCGLLNYFGAYKVSSMDIRVKPIIFEKDGIKIALYGMGFIPDLKLKAAMDRDQIYFEPPPQDTFNILVVHQNRVPHVRARYIPDSMYPKFIHLLIRGHEHDTLAPTRWPESEVDGFVYQPGSTVATSISPQESAPKKVAVMSVSINDPHGDRSSMYKLDYDLISLKCQRAMLMKDIPQREIFDHIKKNDQRRKLTPMDYRAIFRTYVTDSIKRLLDNNKKSSNESNHQYESSPEGQSVYEKLSRLDKPLLKLRLEYKNKAEKFDDLEIASKFYPEFIANRDIISFRRQKIKDVADGKQENITFSVENEDDDEDEPDEFDVINLAEERRDTIDTMIENYFASKPKSECLEALSLGEYVNAVRGSSEDGNVISKVLARKKSQILKLYKEALSSEDIAESKFAFEPSVNQWFRNALLISPINGNSIADLIDGEDDGDVVIMEE